MGRMTAKKIEKLKKEFHGELDQIKGQAPDFKKSGLSYSQWIKRVDPAWYSWAWHTFKFNAAGRI